MPPSIISGGQTGADRAALDWAIANHVPHGGKCPKGRRAEDGPIDARYNLTELKSVSYLARTKANVVESDATVIFTIAAKLAGGSKRTAEFAKQAGKPWLHLSAETDGDKAGKVLRGFLKRHPAKLLNVAGSRGSKEPSVGDFLRKVLDEAVLG